MLLARYDTLTIYVQYTNFDCLLEVARLGTLVNGGAMAYGNRMKVNSRMPNTRVETSKDSQSKALWKVT